MADRRLVGIGPGIARAHTVRVLDGTAEVGAKRRCWPTVASLEDEGSTPTGRYPAPSMAPWHCPLRSTRS